MAVSTTAAAPVEAMAAAAVEACLLQTNSFLDNVNSVLDRVCLNHTLILFRHSRRVSLYLFSSLHVWRETGRKHLRVGTACVACVDMSWHVSARACLGMCCHRMRAIAQLKRKVHQSSSLLRLAGRR